MTSMWNRHRDRRHDSRSVVRPAAPAFPRGFTLIELLVVMGIIAILGVITTVSYSAIAKDARLSSGKNAVAAVLDTARGLAMKNNRVIVVVFRPVIDGYNKQRVEAVTAQWTGESVRTLAGGTWNVVDRFAPVSGVANRVLPHSITIASPQYGLDLDSQWVNLSNLSKINQQSGAGEAPGVVIGVMYAPDGTTITRNTATDASRFFVDFDNDGQQQWNLGVTNFVTGFPSGAAFNALFDHRYQNDEPWIQVAPFISVMDDDEVRSLYDTSAWTNFNTRVANYTQYISNNIDPIYFNRYTGVAMK